MEIYAELKYYSGTYHNQQEGSLRKKGFKFPPFIPALQTHTHTLIRETYTSRWGYLPPLPLTDQRFILQFVSTYLTCLLAKLATVLGRF